METSALLAIGVIAVMEAAADVMSARGLLEFLVGGALMLGLCAALRQRRSQGRPPWRPLSS